MNAPLPIEYNGPPELAKMWEAYATDFIFHKGERKEPDEGRLRAVNLLNTLAFKTHHIKDFLRNIRQGHPAYKRMLNDIKNAAEPLAELFIKQNTRPLHAEIEHRLLDLWVAIRNEAGVVPGGLQGATQAAAAIEIKNRVEFSKTPGADFLSEAIHDITPIVYLGRGAMGKAGKRFTNEQILGEAGLIFIDALYGYKLDQDNKFATFLTSRLKFALFRRLTNPTQQDVSLSTATQEGEGELDDVVADKDATRPDDIASGNNVRQQMRQAVDALKDAEEKMIVRLRFGLQDGVDHTQEETAIIMGISRSTVIRKETKALDHIREIIEGGEAAAETQPEEKEYGFVNHGRRYVGLKRMLGLLRYNPGGTIPPQRMEALVLIILKALIRNEEISLDDGTKSPASTVFKLTTASSKGGGIKTYFSDAASTQYFLKQLGIDPMISDEDRLDGFVVSEEFNKALGRGGDNPHIDELKNFLLKALEKGDPIPINADGETELPAQLIKRFRSNNHGSLLYANEKKLDYYVRQHLLCGRTDTQKDWLSCLNILRLLHVNNNEKPALIRFLAALWEHKDEEREFTFSYGPRKVKLSEVMGLFMESGPRTATARMLGINGHFYVHPDIVTQLITKDMIVKKPESAYISAQDILTLYRLHPRSRMGLDFILCDLWLHRDEERDIMFSDGPRRVKIAEVMGLYKQAGNQGGMFKELGIKKHIYIHREALEQLVPKEDIVARNKQIQESGFVAALEEIRKNIEIFR